MTSEHARLGPLCGLAAAALFGLSAPLAKTLLGEIPPVLLAGLLYLGAALGLWTHRALRPVSREAGLRRADAPALAGVVLAGGVLGPVLMLLGLERVSAVTGSLLLNLEAVFTLLLATALFREHLGRYAAGAAVLILGGAAVLRGDPAAWFAGSLGGASGGGSGAFAGESAGVLLLAGACFAWGLDNNLTQRLSVRDPFAIVRVKTLGAGLTNTVLGLTLAGGALPSAGPLAGALLLGSLSYGLSVVLDAYALRLVGAAREAAYFATAPFIGALAAVPLHGERLEATDLAAMAAMALGVMLLLRERHGHEHEHEPLTHEHAHRHDAHHQHAHGPDDPVGPDDEPHSHVHHHPRLIHDHPHLPDAHHRHRH